MLGRSGLDQEHDAGKLSRAADRAELVLELECAAVTLVNLPASLTGQAGKNQDRVQSSMRCHFGPSVGASSPKR